MKAAIAGAAAGAVGAAVNGGNIFKGAITGAISGMVFGGIGVSELGDTSRIFAHAVAGGTMSVIQGGKFDHGFISNGFAKFATLNLGYTSNITSQKFHEVMGRTAVAALVGDTASQLGGGKFANGARSAAVAHLFNAEASAAQKESGPSLWDRINPFSEHNLKLKHAELQKYCEPNCTNSISPEMAATFSELTGGTLGAASVGRLNVLSGNGAKLLVTKPDVPQISRELKNELMAIGLDILVEVSDPNGGFDSKVSTWGHKRSESAKRN